MSLVTPRHALPMSQARRSLVRAIRRAHVGRGYDAFLLRVAVSEFSDSLRQARIPLNRTLTALTHAIDDGLLSGGGKALRATMLDRATWWATEAYVDCGSRARSNTWPAGVGVLAL